MRLSAVIALAAVASGPAAADEVVSRFVDDVVTVYEEPGANDGWPIPQCAFDLPAAVLATSGNLRLQLDSPDGPVWVATAVVVTDSVDELPSASMSRAKADAGWVTRMPGAGDGVEAAPEGDENVVLVVEPDAGGVASAPEAVASRALIVDPQEGIGDEDDAHEDTGCHYVERAAREVETAEPDGDADVNVVAAAAEDD